ncbi:MAG TPA: DUF4188 domain-containing protein [Actinopolymorphaceae bacterium]|jgi:hypothetical protein
MARNRVVPARTTGTVDGEFTVFLIGVRLNKPWKIHRWLPVFVAMPRMLAELSRRPELGLLGYHLTLGPGGPMVIQYWRSSEHLIAYARSTDEIHLPAWRAFGKAVGTSGDVGIWHETYVVAAGAYENVYANMPRFGLAQAGEHRPVGSRGGTARQRLANRASVD